MVIVERAEAHSASYWHASCRSAPSRPPPGFSLCFYREIGTERTVQTTGRTLQPSVRSHCREASPSLFEFNWAWKFPTCCPDPPSRYLRLLPPLVLSQYYEPRSESRSSRNAKNYSNFSIHGEIPVPKRLTFLTFQLRHTDKRVNLSISRCHI